MNYMQKAVLIYDEQAADYIDKVEENTFGVEIQAVEKETFLSEASHYLAFSTHLLLSGSMELVHQLFTFAYRSGVQGTPCSLAFLPLPSQKMLRQAYKLSAKYSDNIEVSLRDDAHEVNLTECNGQLVQFRAVIGTIPLLETWNNSASFIASMKNLVLGVKEFFRLRLDKLDLETGREKVIKSVASGVFLVNQNPVNRLAQALHYDSSMRSQQISLMIISPYSVVEYFKFLFSLLLNLNKRKILPHAVSNIKSETIALNMESFSGDAPKVLLDGLNSVEFPLQFRLIENGLRLNAPEAFWEINPRISADKESIRVDYLPDETERVKYFSKHLPFFSVASEAHFKDLFLQLRNDAKVSSTYLTLILLSTILATFGLFANSAAVVIGAMLLAPLMSPIISFSMGLLRGDMDLLNSSFIKINLGVILALMASFLLTLMIPQVDLSNEIEARIHPNLIDLGVAIIAGIAAAYTKSSKELMSSLAGVAIAVALVPPLATAGIGLGRGELAIFYGASLLFITNLIGITLASTLTFQFLGYSNTVKNKKAMWLILVIMVVLSYPLYRSYMDSLQRYRLTDELVHAQVMINDKPVLIERASINYQNRVKIVNVTIAVENLLTEEELHLLKQKVEQRFSSNYQVRISVKYIL
ncbi:MAG: TIGR00341 family protein [Pseudomonadota bacterium]